MTSELGEVFLFLTNLAWKTRLSIPLLVTTVFLIMDIRLQIEINIQSGQMAAAEFEQLDDSDDEIEDYTTESTDNGSENGNNDLEDLGMDDSIDDDTEYENTANQLRQSLGLS